ncbi:MAG: hypothetical protein IIZ57_06910 [Solobacterium sp.]|nr:hypothetical protein [Solobacterium sp.]
MTWNMINTCNLIVSAVVMASLAAVHHLRNEEIPSYSKTELILLGLSLILMFVPLTITHLEFGFASAQMFIYWMAGTLLCLIGLDAACILMILRGTGRATLMAVCIFTSILFLMNGALLRHILLLASGAGFFILRLNTVLTETEEEKL